MLINNAIHLSQTGFQLSLKYNKRPNDLACLENQFSKKYKKQSGQFYAIMWTNHKKQQQPQNSDDWLAFFFFSTVSWIDVETITYLNLGIS